MGVSLSIFYNNNNVTSNLEQYVESITYKSNIVLGELAQYDDLEIVLSNKGGIMLGSNYPLVGSNLSIEITDVYEQTAKYSGFYIDYVDASISKKGGEKMTIKASTYSRLNLLASASFQVYNNLTAHQLLQQISNIAKIPVQFDFEDFPLPNNLIQNNISYFEFLHRYFARQYGMTIGIKEGVMYIDSLDTLEGRPSILSLNIMDLKNNGVLLSANFVDDISFEHKFVEVKYQNYNSLNAKIKTYEILPNPTNQTVLIAGGIQNDKTEQLQYNALSGENLRFIVRGVIVIRGNVLIRSGFCIDITGYGAFNGKYMIKSVSLTITKSGFTQTIEVYKTVEQIKSDINNRKQP